MQLSNQPKKLITLNTKPSQEKTQARLTSAERSATRSLGVKFMLFWLLSVGILCVFALAFNADWCKPQFETALCQLFHRKVRLGHMSWSIGFNGLAIATNKVDVDEMNDAPFLRAQRTEIGVSFRRLLQGNVELHHLDFRRPEFWFKREMNGDWNFTDLIKFGPDVRIIQIGDGRLHLTDMAAPPAYQSSINLDKLQLKFVWPKKKVSKPFFLSFELKQPKYKTEVQLDGLGVGAIEDWKSNHYTIALLARRVNPDDALRLASYIMKPKDAVQVKTRDLSGLFDVTIKGDGTLDKGIKLAANMQAEGLVINDPQLGTIKTANARSEGRVTIDKQKIAWQELSLKLPGMQLMSNGHFNRSDGKRGDYQTSMTGSVEDLKVLNKLLSAPSGQGKSAQSPLMMLDGINPERLTGKAEVIVTIENIDNRTEIESKFNAGGLALRDILEEAAPDNARFAIIAGVPVTSFLKGDIHVIPGEKLEVRSAQTDIVGGKVTIAGDTVLKSRVSNYVLEGNSIDLSKVSANMNSSPGALKELATRIAVPPKTHLLLRGQADLKAKLERRGSTTRQDIDLILHNADFYFSDGSLNINKLNGKIGVTDREFVFDNVTGTIDGGPFSLSGRVPYTGTGMNLAVAGAKVDLGKLTLALQTFKMQIPQMAGITATGKVKQAQIKLTGALSKPIVAGTAIPEDVRLELSDLKRFIRATEGSLNLTGEVLTLKDMTLTTRGGSAQVTARIAGVPGEAKFLEGRIKSQGLDLADFDAWIHTKVVPEQVRKDYDNMLATYSVAKVHGKVYGDILLKDNPHSALPRFDGVIGLMDVGFRVEDEKIGVNRLSGVLATSGDDLLLQDIAGWINGSQFQSDGYIRKFRSPAPELSCDIRGSLNSAEINQLISTFSPAKKASQLKFTCQGPLDVRLKANGTREEMNVSFSGRASQKSSVKLYGPFGVLHQPTGEVMSLDGAVTIHPKGVTVNDAHLFCSESVLNFKGEIKVKDDNNANLLKEQVINLAIITPNPLPARRLLAGLAPQLAEEQVSGTIKVDGAIAGPMSNPKINGNFDLVDVTIPKVHLSHATGRMLSRDPYDPRSQAAPINAHVEMSELEVKGIKVTDVSGEMSFKPSSGEDKLPKIRLANMKVKAGGGNINLNAWLDPETEKFGAKSDFKGVDLSVIATGLFGHPGELTGTADGDLLLKSQGSDKDEMIRNLNGTGKFHIKNGVLARFGRLQTRLTQANVLKSGVLGFNLNNLLQSVVPVRTGEFKELIGSYAIARGMLAFTELKYNGEDMRLWGGGTANLADGKVNMEIAGTLPRVTSSVLRGPLGHVSRGITIQKLLNAVTFNKLEKLPSLPVLGDLAGDKPRTFTFKMSAPLDEPNVLAQSIEKSFKWLPSKPLQSAHPVPGIDTKLLEAKAN
ncbi:MAG: hypothetical protein IT342_03530 [Candidatus Melainabacteria bacterium]|nr:hypothetical protein [Candidatus Melainabacteria bacterium]